MKKAISYRFPPLLPLSGERCSAKAWGAEIPPKKSLKSWVHNLHEESGV